MEKQTTSFSLLYDSFFSKITTDMFMELTEADTKEILRPLAIAALQEFEFPRVDIFDFTFTGENDGVFNVKLTTEELNIIATYMVVEWLGQQIASVENIRMKYSGTDFKFTSQANHLEKLLKLKNDYKDKAFHLQRLYKRRKRDENGRIVSTFGSIMWGD